MTCSAILHFLIIFYHFALISTSITFITFVFFLAFIVVTTLKGHFYLVFLKNCYKLMHIFCIVKCLDLVLASFIPQTNYPSRRTVPTQF